ncbi:hypothetical protein DSO57_1038227, partial [Entomophthora muscae]
MALPTNWRQYKEGQDVPTGYSVFNNIFVYTKQYNFLSTQGVLNLTPISDVLSGCHVPGE